MRKIKFKKANSWVSLHKALNITKGQKGWIYRGHSDAEWHLIPKVGRPPYSDDSETEKKVFDFWHRECANNIDAYKRSTIELLAMGQHHGLATRLLDWSYSPLTAAYFASLNAKGTDAAIYIYRPSQQVSREVDPFTITGVPIYKPGSIGERIISQQGLFTVHSEPERCMATSLQPKDELIKVIISRDYVEELHFDLDRYGVNTMTMFPDLDGVARFTDWAVVNASQWK